MDGVAIDRGDEGLVQQVDRVVRDAIAALFDGLDVEGAMLQLVETAQHGLQLAADLHTFVRQRLEVIEEAVLLRHEFGEHVDPRL
jgi:hypothetical protein